MQNAQNCIRPAWRGHRYITKTLLVMKLTVLLLTAGFLSVYAAGTAQSVSFSGKDVPLEKVLSSIKKQTGFVFMYTEPVLRSARPVSIAVTNVPLKTFLDQLFNAQPLEYIIKGKSIFISVKPPAIPLHLSGMEDLKPIRGRVVGDDGKPLAGASITIKKSKIAIVTSPDGFFMLNVNEGDIVVASYIGHKSKELVITPAIMAGVIPTITLTKTTSPLDEVQVIAYGTTTKRFNTGNVSTVKGEDLVRQPVTNLLAALSGMVPGLIITQQSGLPGSNFKVELRGQNSILNSGAPLYIVDGIPYASESLGQVSGNVMNVLGKLQVSGDASEAGQTGLSPLNSLNINDIESVDVLKDADATAIYGSRGANGVILITTKKGKSGETRLNANVYYGSTTLGRKPEFLDTKEYLSRRREYFRNDGTTPGGNDYDLNGTWDTTRNVNWVDELIRPNSTMSAQLSLSGGSGSTQYLVGVNYVKASPPYEGNFSDKRVSVNFNVSNTAFNNKLRVTLSGSYSHDNNTLPGLNTFGNLNLAPNYPSFFKEDGSLNWWGTAANNPYASLLKTYNANTKVLVSNMMLQYRLLQNLTLRTSFGFTTTQFNETRLNPLSSMNPLLSNNISTALSGNNSRNAWVIEPGIEYRENIGQGTLNVMFGATLQHNMSEGETISAYNFISDAAMGNIGAAAQTTLSNNYSKYRYAAIFGRINYTYQNKYILNLTGRRDGSSRFAPARRIANFGAVGAAWIFSEEKLIRKNLPFLSFGKLRGSYGLTGNDGIGNYRYLNTYSVNTNVYYGQPGLYPTRLFSTDYSWESNKKLEGAIELGFLNDRIITTVSWFNNRCSNQLISMNLPPTSGNTNVQANLPALIQNTGWEFELTTKNIDQKDFSWRTNFNLTTSKNKLVSFPGLATSIYASTYVEGQPINVMKLYNGAGVDPTSGLYMFRKYDGTHALIGLTQDDRTVIRSTIPAYFGTIMNTVRYKNWQLNVSFNYVKQTGKNILFGAQNSPFSSPTNVPVFFTEIDHWMKPGDISRSQKYGNAGFAGSAYSAAGQSTLAYTDASFIRCKNVAVSYQLNKKWLKAARLQNGSVYFSAQNLFTITKYLGYDPETQGSILPPMRTITFGLQLSL